MDCGIARNVIYVACHSVLRNEKEAEAMFAQIIDDVQTALGKAQPLYGIRVYDGRAFKQRLSLRNTGVERIMG